jgi:hypothetical protein
MHWQAACLRPNVSSLPQIAEPLTRRVGRSSRQKPSVCQRKQQTYSRSTTYKPTYLLLGRKSSVGIEYLVLVYSMWISCDYKLHGHSKIHSLHVLCSVKYFCLQDSSLFGCKMLAIVVPSSSWLRSPWNLQENRAGYKMRFIFLCNLCSNSRTTHVHLLVTCLL